MDRNETKLCPDPKSNHQIHIESGDRCGNHWAPANMLCISASKIKAKIYFTIIAKYYEPVKFMRILNPSKYKTKNNRYIIINEYT